MTNPPLDQAAQALLDEAQREARRLNHKSIGTEHLLLAMLSVGPADIQSELQSIGLSYDALSRVFYPSAPVADASFPISPTKRTEGVLGEAATLATRHGNTDVGPVHLLAALFVEAANQKTIFGQTLSALGISAVDSGDRIKRRFGLS